MRDVSQVVTCEFPSIVVYVYVCVLIAPPHAMEKR